MRSTLLTMLLCWSVPGSAGADDTAALIRCERAVEHAELARDHCLGDLSKALAGRSEADTAARHLEARMHEIDAQMQAAEGRARSRATWAAGVAAVATAALVGGLAVREPLVAIGGGVALGVALVVARW